MLYFLVPFDVVRRREGEIYEVMGEYAVIAVEEDTSSLPCSRKECLEYACTHFLVTDLEDTKLIPELTKLVRTLDSQ